MYTHVMGSICYLYAPQHQTMKQRLVINKFLSANPISKYQQSGVVLYACMLGLACLVFDESSTLPHQAIYNLKMCLFIKRCISFYKIILCNWIRQNSNLLKYRRVDDSTYLRPLISLSICLALDVRVLLKSLIFWYKSWKYVYKWENIFFQFVFQL